MGRNQYRAGRVYDLCVYYMTGTPEGSSESGFMEKPGIEPATPGLQGIALIHYTTEAGMELLWCGVTCMHDQAIANMRTTVYMYMVIRYYCPILLT